MVDTHKVDEPERADLVVVDAQPGLLELLVVSGIIHDIHGICRAISCIVLSRHGLIDLVGVEPEVRLQYPGEVAVEGCLIHDEHG